MRVFGRMIECTVEAYSLGQTEGNILVDTSTTKSKEQANIRGPAEDIMKGSGSTGSNMATDNLPMPKAKAKKESGKMAKYYNG